MLIEQQKKPTNEKTGHSKEKKLRPRKQRPYFSVMILVFFILFLRSFLSFFSFLIFPFVQDFMMKWKKKLEMKIF